MALLDDLGYGGDQFRLEPSQFGADVGLLDPITLARMERRGRSVPAPHGPGAAVGAPTTPVDAAPLDAPQIPRVGWDLAERPRPPGVSVPAPHGPGAPVAAPTTPVQTAALPAPVVPATPSPAEPSIGPGPPRQPWFRINRDAQSPQVGGILGGGGIERPVITVRPSYDRTPGPGRGIGSDFVASPPVDTPPGTVQTVPGTVANTPLPNRYTPAGPVALAEDKPPLTQQQIAASQPAAKNWWDQSWGPVDDFLKKNANVFLGIGMGFGGARSLGEAFSRASAGVQEGAQLDRKVAAINLTKQALMAKGYSEEEADALANNSTLMQGAMKNLFPSWQKVGENLYGAQYGYPPPPVERQLGPGGKYYVRHGRGPWTVENP